MMNPISFGSTYRAYITRGDVQNGQYSHPQLLNYLDDNDIQYSQKFYEPKHTPTYFDPYKTDISSQYIPSIKDYAVSRYTVVAPDEYDGDIETILSNKGIKFEKIKTDKLLDENNIKKRITPASKGYYLAYVNPDKLEKLLENQDSNFKHARHDYDSYFKEDTDFALKSGDRFSAQTLSISYLNNDGSAQSLKRYVDHFGKDNLNPRSISIWQSQRGDDGYVNTYFALKDLGFKKIPVYMDINSYTNAQTLGILG